MLYLFRGRRGRDRNVVGFTTTYIQLRNNSCRPYFIVIQIWVSIIFMNI